MQKLSIGTSAAAAALVTATTDDLALAVPTGPMLCLQSDVGFWYRFRNSASPTPSVTNYSGDFPGAFVAANQQEFVQVGNKDLAIDAIAASSGTLVIHLVQQQ